MVDDVLGSLWAKSVVDGHAEEGLRATSQIDNLPFWAVLAPQTDTVLLAGDANVLVQCQQTTAQVRSSLLDLAICLPGVIAKGLGHWVVWSSAKASSVRISIG